MTAEVVVINRSGVALAADSVVTLQVGDNTKVRDSALKLFMLSKFRPVGVMIYQDSSLLGVPWETIIKLFRQRFGQEKCCKLTDYGNALMEFLDGNSSLFPQEVQDRYYLQTLEFEFRKIERKAREELADRRVHEIRDSPTTNREDIECIEHEIERAREDWENASEVSDFSDEIPGEIAGRNSGGICELIQEIFGNWELDSDYRAKLREIARMVVSKDRLPNDAYSGLVIAGFGEDEHYPTVQHFEVSGVYEDRLKVLSHDEVTVSEDTPARVIPFAYTEMVESFLYGFSSSALGRLEDAITFIQRMPEEVVNAVPGLSYENREEVAQVVVNVCERKAMEFGEAVIRGSIERRTEIETALQALTVKELAQVASTLVSLSSFQKQMSLGQETVGGPVDVAVISKGDGFVWIDRKHYFRPELNTHFFQNYHREES